MVITMVLLKIYNQFQKPGWDFGSSSGFQENLFRIRGNTSCISQAVNLCGCTVFFKLCRRTVFPVWSMFFFVFF